MHRAKAVVMDYIGTLVNAHGYNLDASREKLHTALAKAGFDTGLQPFLEAYSHAHEKYRVMRYEKLQEVTNAVWVSEALCTLGYKVNAEDTRVKTALNVFFQDYIKSLKLRPFAKPLLRRITETCKLGLVSNFTYAPVIYASLRKLGINTLFSAILVSDENEWRKPHARIFQDALSKLQVTAEEAVYVGDSPMEDIKGALEAGMKTVFVPSQFYSLEDLRESRQKPDVVAGDLKEILKNLSCILTVG